jgi:hypothetical protein
MGLGLSCLNDSLPNPDIQRYLRKLSYMCIAKRLTLSRIILSA